MPAAATVAVAARHRRGLLAVALAGLALSALLVLGVMVVALGGVPQPSGGPAGAGIPPVAIDAYQRAAETPEGQQCGIRWQILAGIARVESNHAAGHTIDEDGTVSPAILGPTLDGSGGTARIADSDQGALDGDEVWDRAVGPFQFIPTSWTAYGADGNDDGEPDPNNIYDAALGAVDHLCGEGVSDLAEAAQFRTALFAYNRSVEYVDEVIRWITSYDGTDEAPTGAIVSVRGIRVDQSIALELEDLLAAAEAADLDLNGSGWRSPAQQIALREAHCGRTQYAIYEMPASQCRPPTARPGSSKHERGLAIDFTHDGASIQRGSRADTWLMANAPRFGLHNLPSEAWHYSIDGS